jgi:hypothetical protein
MELERDGKDKKFRDEREGKSRDENVDILTYIYVHGPKNCKIHGTLDIDCGKPSVKKRFEG